MKIIDHNISGLSHFLGKQLTLLPLQGKPVIKTNEFTFKALERKAQFSSHINRRTAECDEVWMASRKTFVQILKP